MKCPRCGNEDCVIISEQKTTGKNFCIGESVCGYIIFGPIGLLCGACGEGKKTDTLSFWVCKDCGNKWKV